MGDMADYYADLAMSEMFEYEKMARGHELSKRTQQRVGRYDVKDEDIRDLLFNISLLGLCKLTDKVIEEEFNGEYSELDKIIDIMSWGLSKKYLSEKQKWCLASFCIYYMGGI